MVATRKASSSVSGSIALTKGGLPRGFGTWSPADRRDWLGGPECRAAVANGRLQQSKVEAEIRRAKTALGRIAHLAASPALHYCFPFPPPSENTPMRQADYVLDEQHEAQVLWPAPYLSGGRWVSIGPIEPGQQGKALAGGATFDVVCHDTEMRRRRMDFKPARGEAAVTSPTTEALAELCARGIRLAEAKLPTDEADVLREQIAAYLEGRSVSILTLEFERK